MRSFIFSLLATLFFGVLASAIPLPHPGQGLQLRGAHRSVAIIVTEAQSKITPLTQKIASATSTGEIAPIAAELKTILEGVVVDIKGLAGQPINIILGAVDGVGETTVPELAKLVADLLTNVVDAVVDLEDTIGAEIKGILSGVLCDVFTLVGDILSLIDGLVDGLLDQLIPYLSSLIHFIFELNLDTIIEALHL